MLRWRPLVIAVFCLSLSATAAFARPQQDDAQSSTTDSQQDNAPIAGTPGSRFLVTLETRISSKQDKVGKAFAARTLDPIAMPDGVVLPPGTAIRGHVAKVKQAEVMDKARIWLTFDEIQTPHGWAPLAANLIDAPDTQKLHVLYDHEGAIEYAPVKRNDEILAALAAAMSGAAPGVAAKDAKGAATGAAESGAEAFMATAGMGQEITLQPSMKLQLALAHSIHLRRA